MQEEEHDLPGKARFCCVWGSKWLVDNRNGADVGLPQDRHPLSNG